jgi:hypothetical protein
MSRWNCQHRPPPERRCKAKSKRSGQQCKNWTVPGYDVCYYHGANGGAKTRRGKRKQQRANLKHGNCKINIEKSKFMRKIIKTNPDYPQDRKLVIWKRIKSMSLRAFRRSRAKYNDYLRKEQYYE